MSSNAPETVEDLRALFVTEAETPEPTTEPETPEVEPDPEPEPEAEPAAAEAEPEGDGLLAGKYKDVQALEAAYLEAQAALGRQGSKLGNLRKLEQEMQSLREALPTQQPQQNYDPGSLDEYLQQNPQQIPAFCEQAIASGDGYAYQRGLANWAEYDSVGAMDYHARKVNEAGQAQLRQEMAPVLATVQRQQTTSEMAAAYETMAGKHQDFNTVMNGVSQATLDGFPPEVLTALQTGDQASKERVLETLYRWSKSEQAGTLTEAATAAVTQAAQDSRAAKQDAAVATPTGSLDREPVILSPVDAYRQEFQNSEAFKRATGELKHR